MGTGLGLKEATKIWEISIRSQLLRNILPLFRN